MNNLSRSSIFVTSHFMVIHNCKQSGNFVVTWQCKLNLASKANDINSLALKLNRNGNMVINSCSLILLLSITDEDVFSILGKLMCCLKRLMHVFSRALTYTVDTFLHCRDIPLQIRLYFNCDVQCPKHCSLILLPFIDF